MTAFAPQYPFQAGSILGSGSPVGVAGAALLNRLSIWRIRASTRAQLRRLDPEMYRDIGLTAAEVRLEAAKPFWRA